MYKTRLNPPPANGWTPPSHVLAELDRSQVLSVPTAAEDPGADDFELVSPEPPQPRFDFAMADSDRPVKRLIINGEPAIFIRKKNENGKLFITARMVSTGAVKTVTVPPARVKIQES